MKLILASSSPRRQEILRGAGFDFETVSADINEEIGEARPGRLVTELSLHKAFAVSKQNPDAVVIGADTVVNVGGQVLGKPQDEADAARMLGLLSGRIHTVYSGVAIVANGGAESFVSRTRVEFYPLDDEITRRYIATGEPMDKAGAYGIQGRGALLIRSISGDYYNVMGLPIAELCRRLASSYGIRPF